MNTKLQLLGICIVAAGLTVAFERSSLAQAPAHRDVAYDDEHASQCVDVYLAKSDKPTPAMIYSTAEVGAEVRRRAFRGG